MPNYLNRSESRITLKTLESPKEVPPAPCPACGKALDRASGITKDVMPEEGDISICIACVAVSRFDADLRLLPIDWSKVHPEEKAVIERATQTILGSKKR